MTRSKPLPSFVLLAPALVVALGIIAALAMVWVGRVELQAQSDAAALLRARVLADTLAERLEHAPTAKLDAMLDAAARDSGAELALLATDGEVVVDRTRDLPPFARRLEMLVRTSGLEQSERRRQFAVSVVHSGPKNLRLAVLVEAPDPPGAVRTLLASVAAVTALLVGVAALVAYAVARDVHADVEFLRARIVAMASARAGPRREAVPVRAIDQIGLLTHAFNALLARFTAAEQAYRRDLLLAEAADRERAAFLAALSHELRTPLNAILGFTDVLLAEVDGPLSADARENLEVVRNSGSHLRDLIGDILDLSALESGELELSCQAVDVRPIAEEVARELTVAAQSKGVRLTFTGNTAVAWADPRRIRQILSNVLGNAIKFTNEGEVTLDVDAEPGFAVLRVTDTGPGIADEDQSAIFDEYRQVGDLRSRGVGTGLGLSITRRLVQMHRGSVEVESSVGVGSAFTIWLPAEPKPDDDGEAQEDAP
ncbi:MAG: HAMP domain-containing histidine kinase [Polyangiaceae bacterium]|nr:HAMP domain-containing histidine kinase [Polyangiaceae bacterium]